MSARAPNIRAAEPGDGVVIATIYAPYVRNTAISFEIEPPSAAIMAERVGSTLCKHPWLVAQCAGKTVGYAYAGSHRERPAYRWSVDTTVYVTGSARGNGIGHALYTSLLTVLREQGFRSAFAEIVLPNPASVRLHESLGFKPVGVHHDVGFKLGRWHDIGYWRPALAAGAGSPTEPVPFSVFRHTSAFAAALRRSAA